MISVCTTGACGSPKLIAHADHLWVVFARSTLSQPCELFLAPLNQPDAVDMVTDPKQLTKFNFSKLSSIAFGEVQEFLFNGAGNDRVHAWVILPVDFDPAKKYPLAVIIHGGPQGAIQDSWHYRWYACSQHSVVAFNSRVPSRAFVLPNNLTLCIILLGICKCTQAAVTSCLPSTFTAVRRLVILSLTQSRKIGEAFPSRTSCWGWMLLLLSTQ
jgi:hypothetical protein